MVMVAKKRRRNDVGRLSPRWEGWGGVAVTGNLQPPMPEWLEAIHDYQVEVVEQAVKEYERGAKVVFVDAPTGSGKSLIGELVRRRLAVPRGLYVCSTKSLQEQYLRDFPYARVLKGRTNYTPTLIARRGQGMGGGAGTTNERLSRGLAITCADCDKGPPGVPAEDQSCSYCEWVEECPYGTARQEAMRAPVGVLNTSYLLAEVNGPGKFAGRELVVADECDTLEDQLLGYVELRVPRAITDQMDVAVPKKGSHMPTIRGWLEEDCVPAIEKVKKQAARDSGVEGRRMVERLERLTENVKRVVEREDGWVRDNDEEERRGGTEGLVLKPVRVDDLANRYLWRHADRWLCMTGTLVSAEMEAEGLGLDAHEIPWAKVTAPMLFPRENRRVVFAGVATMTRKGQEDGSVDKMLRGIEVVVERHPGVNVLVHTHTYKLAKEVSDHLRRNAKVELGGRPVVTYASSWDRDKALDVFKAAARTAGGEVGRGAVLVAASMDRGVDLPGDLCRVQVIAKVPMASLGSRQVSERMRGRGGQLWYLANTVRTIMQMCGRAVRGQEDWAVTYILDAHFGKVLGDGKKLGLWPEWWLEAVEVGRVREYV